MVRLKRSVSTLTGSGRCAGLLRRALAHELASCPTKQDGAGAASTGLTFERLVLRRIAVQAAALCFVAIGAVATISNGPLHPLMIRGVPLSGGRLTGSRNETELYFRAQRKSRPYCSAEYPAGLGQSRPSEMRSEARDCAPLGCSLGGPSTDLAAR